MKKLCFVLNLIFGTLTAIVGLAFSAIEARLLISGDWLLYEHALIGLFQYLIRLLIALYAVFVGIMTFVRRKRQSAVFHSCILAAAVAGICVFATNGLNLYLLTLSALQLCA